MKNKKLFAILTLVCFMMTLMPVAAFAAAGPADAQTSYIFTNDTEASAATGEKVELSFKIQDAAVTTTSAAKVYVWAIQEGQNVPTTALAQATEGNTLTVTGPTNAIFEVSSVKTGDVLNMKFTRAGEYKVYASFVDPSTVAGSNLAAQISQTPKLQSVGNQQTVTVTGTASSSSKYYMILDESVMITSTDVEYKLAASDPFVDYANNKLTTGATVQGVRVDADNVSNEKIKLTLYNDENKVVPGATVKFSTNSANLTVSNESVKTNALGEVEVKLAGATEGEYKLYITCGAYEMIMNVTVGSTGATYVEVQKSPKDPIDVDRTDLKKTVRFVMSDINGNLVLPSMAATNGAKHAFGVASGKKDINDNLIDGKANAGYVTIVSQPSASKLKDSDVKLVADTTYSNSKGEYIYSTLDFNGKPLVAEGTYTFKVVLDNGCYTTVTIEVKEFTTPVELILTYPADSVALGATTYINDLLYKDANGVTKDATNYVTLAATGYAINSFDTNGSDKKGKLVVKSDEKYVGSEITVTAVDERYNLVASTKLTVADEATALAFSTKTAEVDVNNQITVMLVDGNGNRVTLGGAGYEVDSITYVVLDKPEGAKVSATTASVDNNLTTAGTFKMNLVSNKIGNVTVQVMAKVSNRNTSGDTNAVTKYYTGTQIFAVGTGSVGDVVVMSIGSHEIVVNDKKATIDAAPMIQNDRTFVPFRALAEAFGAEVAYDEATQAVTAKLNGVEVVMTIGSATYTVNGAEKTADVAPFINGSRTMVPVRFAAEAFGIKVIPTYNPDGTTADILFNL